MTGVAAILAKPFSWQVAAWRIRLAELKATASWRDVWKSEHDRSFMVAGAMKAELLADFAAAIDKAITKGTSLAEFGRDFDAAVEAHDWKGWTGSSTEKGQAWRKRVIYQTNLSVSYAAGRHAQLLAGKFKYWVYFHGNSRDPRPEHKSWDGLILEPEHPFWRSHYPPNGWGCSCYVIGARSLEHAVALGGKPGLKLPESWDAIDAATGEPEGISKGWGYAPGATVANAIQVVASKAVDMPATLSAAMVATWPDDLFTLWSKSFARFVDQSLQQPPTGKTTIVGVMKPQWVTGAATAGHLPLSSEIAVRDRDILHAFRNTKSSALEVDWYRDLPRHLRSPSAVLLDVRKPEEPTLLLIFQTEGTGQKIALRINYRIKGLGTLNLLRTGSHITPNALGAIKGQVRPQNPDGWYVLIDGELP